MAAVENLSSLAPCVAVVGPANSGKSTFLNLLDQALQQHPEAPLVYVVKGNPDGTGRYLLHAPELREPLKDRVKGRWGDSTIATISEWVEASRRHLDLVLVDFGGKHDPSNAEMLRRCTHAIVVARCFEAADDEAEQGMESWAEECRRCGLAVLARVRSELADLPQAAASGHEGPPPILFRAASPFSEPSATAGSLIERLAEALLALRVRRPRPTYFDLRLGRDWTEADLMGLGGLAAALEEQAQAGQVVLGGRAPVWAYCAALHRVLDRCPSAQLSVFDPKVASGLVPIPSSLQEGQPCLLSEAVSVSWRPGAGSGDALLDVTLTTTDRFLPPAFTSLLDAAPRPAGPPPAASVAVSGAAPIWLHLTYSRWLRSQPSIRSLGVWDTRSRSVVWVHRSSERSAEPTRGATRW